MKINSVNYKYYQSVVITFKLLGDFSITFWGSLRPRNKKVYTDYYPLDHFHILINASESTKRYSQGKTGVSLSSVQEWLVGCFWSFSYVNTINSVLYIPFSLQMFEKCDLSNRQ